jgi:outer membrane immunogenic protein
MGLRSIFRGLTVVVCTVTVSSAADFGTGPGSLLDTPVAVAAWNWSGFYGGVNLAYGWGTDHSYLTTINHGNASVEPDGALIGGTIGYNYHYTPNWVIGAEADISGGDVSGTGTATEIYDGHYWTGGWDALFTLRGRVGYAFDRALIYGTAGYAALHSNELIAGNNANESENLRGWRSGWVAGGGVEYAFTDRISGKAEWLHAEFEDLTGQAGFQGNMSQKFYTVNSDLNIFRLGVNYKFY